MTQDNMDYSALVASRICHDLISPVGAIGNGIELMAMEGSVGPELDLIANSAGDASARVRFFRIAFGQAGADQLVGANEVRSVLTDLSRGARVRFLWHITRDIPRADLRALFQAMMCLESALPYGGEVSVFETGDRWVAETANQRIALDEPLWDNLSRPTTQAQITPGRVQFGLLPQTVSGLGRDLKVHHSDGHLSISF